MKPEFNITKDAMDKYQISIGIGKIFRANNLDEVALALEHYFRETVISKTLDVHFTYKIEWCPLCREGKKEVQQ
jgi:hypothetical protein